MVWGVVYYSRWSSDSALKESYIPKWGDLGGGCWSDTGRQLANWSQATGERLCERCTRVYESLTCVYERWVDCLEQDLQDFMDFQDGGAPLTQERSFERWTSVHERCTREHERLRAFTSVSRIVWSRICRISWDFRDDGAPLSQERSFERLTSVAREIASVYERSRALVGLSGAGFAGFLGIFGMMGPRCHRSARSSV